MVGGVINRMERCLLEEMLNGIGDIEAFDDIAPHILQFSNDKQLYMYQYEALYNCLKLLYVYYRDYQITGENVYESKKRLMDMYDESYPEFSWKNRLKKYSNEKKLILNEKFSFFVFNRYFEQAFGRNE